MVQTVVSEREPTKPRRLKREIKSPSEYQRQDDVALWWTAPEQTAWRSTHQLCRTIVQEQTTRRSRLFECLRRYLGRSVLPTRDAPTASGRQSRHLSYNAVRASVDTAHAKLWKSHPKPEFLTSDGDWNLQQRAKNLTQYIEGLFYELNIYQHEEDSGRDCLVYGDGAIKLRFALGPKNKDGERTRRLACERVYVEDILVDDSDGYYGRPRSMHHRFFISRQELAAMFDGDDDAAEKLAAIHKAPDASIDLQSRLHDINMIEVVESWHLPSAPLDPDDEETETDGRHVLAIDGCTLVHEDWRKSYFPILFQSFQRPVIGFWGVGLSEMLAGQQAELNEATKRVQVAQRHACAPKLLLPKGAKICKTKIGNDLRIEIMEYDGAIPPSWVTPTAMPTEVYEWIRSNWQMCFESTGVSQMTASAHKPAGLDSGVALREFEDIESERFVLVGQRREQLFIDAAKILIDMSRDLYKDSPELSVRTHPSGGASAFIKTIKWKDVNLRDDEYTMRAWPVSMLPSTPAGKMQKVVELMQNGLVDREQGLQLLDFPDVQKFTGLATAALEDAQMVIDHMINGGDYLAPEPFMDLALCKRIAGSAYLRARTRNVDESNLDKLRTFIADCDDLMARASAPAPGTAAPQPGDPPMSGGPPPGLPMPPPGMVPPMPGAPPRPMPNAA